MREFKNKDARRRQAGIPKSSVLSLLSASRLQSKFSESKQCEFR